MSESRTVVPPNGDTFPQFLVRCPSMDGKHYVKEIGLTAASEDFPESLRRLRQDTAYFVPENPRAPKAIRKASVKKIKRLIKKAVKSDPMSFKWTHKRRKILSARRHGEAVVQEVEAFLRESAHKEWEQEEGDFYAE